LPLSGDQVSLKYIYLIFCAHNLFAALPVTSGTVTFSLLSDGPLVAGTRGPFFLTKNCTRSNYCIFLNLLHQVFGLTVGRPARYPNAGLAGPKPAKSLPLSLRLIPT